MNLVPRLPCLLVAVLLAFAPVSVFAPAADAAVPIGGALDPPGERSHSFGLGWPEFFYTWEAVVRDRTAFGVRVGLQVWPLALSLGAQGRIVLTEQGAFSLSLLAAPAFAFAGYGGSKAVYLQNYQFGRSRTFRPSLGPQLNLGLLASIKLSHKTNILLSFENPVSLWIWTRPTGWWLEWPVIFTGGLEYRVTFAWSLFGRLGAGPSLAFTGPTQLLGVHWHILAGAQIRY